MCGNLVTEGPLISAPEVWVHKVTPDDEFMVLATDGLWDVFTSQRCVEEARSKLQVRGCE
jgi:protein phosphatase 2C family protein 2/3